MKYEIADTTIPYEVAERDGRHLLADTTIFYGVAEIVWDVDVAGVSAPVNTGLPALSGFSGPYVGETITTSNGTWTGSPTSYAYQWQADGVDISGETSSTYTATQAVYGQAITCEVTATNAGGSTMAESAATSAVTTYWYATRAGASDKYLQNSSGQLTDTGASAYDYSGAGASNEVRCEVLDSTGAVVLLGDSVGTPYMYDVTNGQSIGSVEGVPATNRDDGFGPGSSSNRGTLSPPASGSTFAIYFNNNGGGGNTGLLSRTGSGGFNIFCNNDGNVVVQLKNNSDSNLYNSVIAASGTDDIDHVLIVEYDNDTPGSGTGTLNIELWRLDTNVRTTNVSTTYTSSAFTPTKDCYLAVTKGGAGYPDSDLKIDFFTGTKLITSGGYTDLTDASPDPSAGGSRTNEIRGLRTGVYNPADTTELIWVGGAGSDVTAGGP